MTPREHLEKTASLLVEAETRAAPLSVADTIALANAHMGLALALNAVPLLGDAAKEMEELRHPLYTLENHE